MKDGIKHKNFTNCTIYLKMLKCAQIFEMSPKSPLFPYVPFSELILNPRINKRVKFSTK